MGKATSRRGAVRSLWVLLVLGGCDCGTRHPCDGVDCSGVGRCEELPYDTGAYCVCQAGYHPTGGGLECTANDAANPCEGVDCGGYGYCGRSADGAAVCSCFPGWHVDESGLWCLRDGPPGDGGSTPDVVEDSFSDGDEDAPTDADAEPDSEGDGETDGGVSWRDEWVWEPATNKLDLLILMDNSGSMSQEQESFAHRIVEMIMELIDPADSDGDGRPDHPAVEDINVGVVSTDMGTMGFRVSTCSDSERGDDGCMLSRPSPSVLDCEAEYPAFLSRDPATAESYGVEELAHDVACIATLGTSGCGFEQPLKAVDKALFENAAPGGCNEGFLRPDSMVAMILVTDEEDCSVDPAHPEMFDPSGDHLGHINLRCFLYPEFVIPIADYLRSFQRLLPGRLGSVVLGVIAGVPPDAPECVGSGESIEACLDLPAMQERVDPTDPSVLVPSCNTTMGSSYPPRRLVQLAVDWVKGGGRTYVDSICKSDWTGAIRGITSEIVDSIADDTVCVEPLPFDPATCMTSCYLFETLNSDRPCEFDPGCPQEWCPAASPESLDVLRPCRNPVTGEACTPLLRDLGTEGSAGFERRRCLVRQAPRNPFAEHCGDSLVPSAAGWYYLPGAWYGGCSNLRFHNPGREELIDPESSFATLRCRR